MKVFKLFFVFVSATLLSCEFLDDTVFSPVANTCDAQAVIDAVLYQQLQTTMYGINSVVLNDNCLEITISSSGCDPDNWSMNLVTVPSTTAISPHLFHAKVELINNEECLAVFQKTKSFDLTPLQIQGQSSIQIQIDGWNTPVIYNY